MEIEVYITLKEENEAAASAFLTETICSKCNIGRIYEHGRMDPIRWCIHCDWRNYEVIDDE